MINQSTSKFDNTNKKNNFSSINLNMIENDINRLLTSPGDISKSDIFGERTPNMATNMSGMVCPE